MACLKYVCRDCGYVWFENNPSHRCPACGSTDTSQFFDGEEDWDEDLDEDWA